MKLPRNTIFWRLLVSFLLANLVVLILGGFFARGLIDFISRRTIDWTELARAAEQAYDTGGPVALAAWSQQQRAHGIDATLYENGKPLSPVRLFPPFRHELEPWIGRENRGDMPPPRPGGFLVVQQVTGVDGVERQLVAASRGPRLPPGTFEKIMVIAQGLLALLVVAIVSWWVARSVARPVNALREATQRMTAGDLSTRVGAQARVGRDELAQLSDDFDTMAERIEALVAHDRGVLQDLSHELRSPLARMHLILDFAQRSVTPQEAETYFQQAEQELIRMDRMTGDMLALSRLEGSLPGQLDELIELDDLVIGCCDRATLDAQAHGVELHRMAQESATVRGSPQLLERALDNLIANAIKYSPTGGHVELSQYVEHATAEICVRDYGPGAPEAELSSLFRPFFRGSNALRAEGHGLGLSIAQRIVYVHGGSIHAQNAVGGGLEVRMRLPLAEL